MKFLSQRAKRDIYRARVKLRIGDGNQQNPGQPQPQNTGPIIYINEDLTKSKSILYKSVVDVAKPRKWQTFTENGVIYLRNTIVGPAKKILKAEDLAAITG